MALRRVFFLMLRELPVSQVLDDYPRRRFADPDLDLIVWYESDGSIHGFQLAYDPRETPRALTWTRKRGFSHDLVDGGEDSVNVNRSPMLRPSRDYDPDELRGAFQAAAHELPAPEKAFVDDKLDAAKRELRGL
jgi:hypothetical protein